MLVLLVLANDVILLSITNASQWILELEKKYRSAIKRKYRSYLNWEIYRCFLCRNRAWIRDTSLGLPRSILQSLDVKNNDYFASLNQFLAEFLEIMTFLVKVILST